MKNGLVAILSLGLMTSVTQAQDAGYIPPSTLDVGYGGSYNGPGSVGSNEAMFRYDDQERWKHGWVRNMPYYEGYHSFRPYNYHHVFSQTQTAAGWGMPATMPYSQQFWHRYQGMTDLSRGDHSPVAPYVPPPNEFDHYPKPLRQGSAIPPSPTGAMNRPGAQSSPYNYQQQGVQTSLPAYAPTQAASWENGPAGQTAPLLSPY
ncbi:hypothetical protein SH668x_002177 [Planctomicrobium sp. SH668]|uniref:hypothetical protein n=1 Tax=Planctomicrobium sp. SH668 TaxID=3448126 RepID=UPI003F5B6625